MKELQDLKDLTIHDVQSISDVRVWGLGGGNSGEAEERCSWPLARASSSLLLASLELSDTQVYDPSIRARLGTAAHFCEVVASAPTTD